MLLDSWRFPLTEADAPSIGVIAFAVGVSSRDYPVDEWVLPVDHLGVYSGVAVFADPVLVKQSLSIQVILVPTSIAALVALVRPFRPGFAVVTRTFLS